MRRRSVTLSLVPVFPFCGALRPLLEVMSETKLIEKKILVRYWNQPSWPISVRNTLWRQQIEAGVDLLNVDDLKAASGIGYDW